MGLLARWLTLEELNLASSPDLVHLKKQVDRFKCSDAKHTSRCGAPEQPWATLAHPGGGFRCEVISLDLQKQDRSHSSANLSALLSHTRKMVSLLFSSFNGFRFPDMSSPAAQLGAVVVVVLCVFL